MNTVRLIALCAWLFASAWSAATEVHCAEGPDGTAHHAQHGEAEAMHHAAMAAGLEVPEVDGADPASESDHGCSGSCCDDLCLCDGPPVPAALAPGADDRAGPSSLCIRLVIRGESGVPHLHALPAPPPRLA